MTIFKKHFPWNLTAAAVAIVAGWILLEIMIKSDQAGAYTLWLLAFCMAFMALEHNQPKPDQKSVDLILPWGLLALAFIPAIFISEHGAHWSLWLASCAVFAYTGGFLLACKLATPSFIFFVLISSTTYLHLLLGLPLSKICTALTVGILRVLGVECSFDQAIIMIGENSVAVTAACSGIELLEAMLLLGWVVVYLEHKSFWMRLLHYLALLPLIILTNTIRLVVVILLSFQIGEQAFNDPLHSIFGYAVVISTIVLMFLIGKFFVMEK